MAKGIYTLPMVLERDFESATCKTEHFHVPLIEY